MKDIIEGFRTTGAEVITLKDKLKTSKGEVKSLTKTLDGKDDTIDALRRSAEKDRTYFDRETEETIADAEHKVAKVERDVEEKVEEAVAKSVKEITEVKKDAGRDISRAEDKAENRVRRVQEESTHREAILKKDTEAEIKSIRLTADQEANDTYVDVIDSLTGDLTVAKSEAASATASATEKDATISTQKEELKRHDDLIRFVMTKLPEVDLKDFNINVEMPAPEVTVVSAGGKGGNQKKDK